MDAVFLPCAILAPLPAPYAKSLTLKRACVTIRCPKGRFQKGELGGSGLLRMGGCPFLSEVHCEEHTTPRISAGLVDSTISVSFQALDQRPSLSPPLGAGISFSGGSGAMRTPARCQPEAWVFLVGNPGSSLSDYGSSLAIVKRHFLGPNPDLSLPGVRTSFSKCRCVPS